MSSTLHSFGPEGRRFLSGGSADHPAETSPVRGPGALWGFPSSGSLAVAL